MSPAANADGLVDWLIYVNGLTARRNIIAESKSINREIFFALIHFDTPAGEFKAIAFRAMHYFTLGDFLTPIAELRAFCRKNKLLYSERELANKIHGVGYSLDVRFQRDFLAAEFQIYVYAEFKSSRRRTSIW